MIVNNISMKTIERLSLYRRILRNEYGGGMRYIFSHKLAFMAGKSSSQVRRDLMHLKQIANPQKGYNINQMILEISEVLDAETIQNIGLAGIGNMGRAFVGYFQGRGKNLAVKAAFDTDPEKIDRIISGCRTYHISQLKEIVQKEDISIGLIAVPEKEAQRTADMFIEADVKGIINVAPIPIIHPDHVYVETLDFTSCFEKIAYFTQHSKNSKGERK